MRTNLTITTGRLSRRTRSSVAVALAATALLGAACGSSGSGSGTSGSTSGGGGGGGSLSLVAYSTPASAYAKLISAFQKTTAGKGVNISTSFGASGQQARSVIAGLPADVVNFSLEPDMSKLVKAGLVSSSWDTVGPAKGIVTDSVVVFVVRKGNPKHIHTWADLVKPGVAVVTPNPFSSGSARWNLMAAYGAEINLGATPAAADSFLGKLLKSTASQPSSASDAMAAFTQGTGDVLLDYEDDAIGAQRKDANIDYVIPPQTILIQNPIAIVKSTKNTTAAQAFVSFLLSEQGQEIWAKEGYRPVIASAASAAGVTFPTPAKLFTIDSIGGWTTDAKTFFDPTSGIVAKIEQSLGVSTSSS
jgi:sulfate transport system substrate-binding protein